MAAVGAEGFVYAFFAFGVLPDGRRVLKVGRTGDWAARARDYVGLNVPDPEALCVCPAAHVALAEERLIATCRVHFPLFAGHEWFAVDGTAATFDFVTRAVHQSAEAQPAAPSVVVAPRRPPEYPHVRQFIGAKLAGLAPQADVVCQAQRLADEYNAYARVHNLPAETAVSFGRKLSLMQLAGVGEPFHTKAGSARRMQPPAGDGVGDP